MEDSLKRGFEESSITEGALPPTKKHGKFMIKVLVENSHAGPIVGKAGANIKQLQEESGASIKISHNGMHYPGTDKRTVLIMSTESIDRIALGLAVLVNSLTQSLLTVDALSRGLGPPSELRLSIPNSAAGCLIGKGGETIKQMSAKCGGRISVVARDAMHPAVEERLVVINGTPAQQIEGAKIILEQLNTSPGSFNYSNPSTSYNVSMAPSYGSSGGYGGGGGGGSYGGGGGGGHAPLPPPTGATKIFTVQIPDSLVGKLVGKGGQTLRELEMASGTKLSVSKKGEFLAGTQNRIVTINGEDYGIALVQRLINEKLTGTPQVGY